MIGDEHVEVQAGEKNEFPGYSITINDSGVYLIIHTLEEGISPVNETAIYEQLNRRDVRG